MNSVFIYKNNLTSLVEYVFKTEVSIYVNITYLYLYDAPGKICDFWFSKDLEFRVMFW